MKSDVRLFKPPTIKKIECENHNNLKLKLKEIEIKDVVTKKDIPSGYYYGYGYYDPNDQCLIT